jgi:hypothetical protein
MALSVDTVSAGASDPSTTTLTWSHTTATDANLIVVTVGESRAVTISSITYNGAALTASASVTNGNSRAYVYYRVNPDKGANDVVVTYSGAITVPRAGAVTFKGANMVGPIGATNTKTGTAQNKTIDLTTLYDGSATVECVGALGGIHTADSGQTVINAGGNNRIGFYELQGDAGLYTQNLTADSSADYSYVVVEVRAGSATYSLDLESGSSQYASIADASQTGLEFERTDSFSIMAWVKRESTGASMGMVSKIDTGLTGQGYYWYFPSNDITRFILQNSDSNRLMVAGPANTFTGWQHIAMTYSGGSNPASVKIYYNGKSQTVSTETDALSATTVSSNDFSVGSKLTTHYFDGLIKDVRVFNDVLTAAEVAEFAHTESVSDANLQGEWNFDNAYTDASGNGNTLTASGSPVFITDVPWVNATQVSGSTYLDTNLTSFYTMDSDSTDSTSNSYDGTDTNTPTYTSGKISNAFTAASASSQYTTVSNSLVPWGTNKFSWAGWVKLSATTGNQMWMGVARTGKGVLIYKSGTDTITFSKPNVVDLNYTWSAIDTSYHHWAFVGNSSGMFIYLDGALVTSGTNTANFVDSDGDTIPIGAYKSGGSIQASWYLNGQIDELAVYSRALQYGDVLDLYNAGSGITWIAPPAATGKGNLMLLGVGA